nr:hypothetical protein [uncultured Corynebacterium sp.]
MRAAPGVAGPLGWCRALGDGARTHPGGSADSAVTQRRSSPAAPDTTSAPPQQRPRARAYTTSMRAPVFSAWIS